MSDTYVVQVLHRLEKMTDAQKYELLKHMNEVLGIKLHIMTPEEEADLRAWLPSEEQAQQFFSEISGA